MTFYEATAHLARGGRSLEELQRFPEHLAKDLAESETAMDVLSAGLVLDTDYSGLDVPAVVMWRIQHYLQTLGKVVVIEHHRSCDIHPGCQELLTSSAQAAGHVFADILDRLPQEWRERVDDLAERGLAANSNLREAEIESYEAVGTLIRNNSSKKN